jgi:hypothetical protein
MIQFDEQLLVETLVAVTAATFVLSAILLLFSPRRQQSSAKKSKSIERRPADRYTDELAA